MKDQHDCSTIDIDESSLSGGKASLAAAPRQTGKSFNYFGHFTVDQASAQAGLPDCAQVGSVPELAAMEGHFVPVSFVAKDWNVTPRRIRALLTAGRLAGRAQLNGYWEVRYPYLFALGTRGPFLKRQQRPPKRPRLVVDNTEGK
jgi:hypothetical protein